MERSTVVRLFFATLFGLAGAASGLGPAASQEASPPAASPVAATVIEIRGHVASPRTLTVADLQALPSETVDVTYRMADGTQARHSYTGPRLWDALQLAQPTIDPDRRESTLHLYVVLTARDGYIVVLSLGEIDPEFGGQPYLLAWAEDGQPLAGERAPAMLVVPGDVTEGRYIYGVVSIAIRSIDDEPGT